MPKTEVPPYRALILEDHDFQRKVGKQILKMCGAAEIIEAASGADAIAALEAGAVDILVCDLNMPGMDGLEFLRRIGDRKSAAAVILASGVDADALREAETTARGYGLTILGAVEKPISQAKLLPLVLKHFGQSVAAS